MASNRGHLDRYRCTNLLFGVHLILHHNFMRFFGSLLDLVMDALDVRMAARPVLPSHKQHLQSLRHNSSSGAQPYSRYYGPRSQAFSPQILG